MKIHCCKGNILKMRCVARIVVSVGGITASREVVRLLIIVVVVIVITVEDIVIDWTRKIVRVGDVPESR